MGNFGLGLKTLLRIWSDADFARRVRDLDLPATPTHRPAPTPASAPAPAPAPAPRRSDALGLLALLQREARFVDFIQEPIAAYSDAQIGAAVRDVHQGCATVLQRVFALEPLSRTTEGGPVEVPRGFDPASFRLTGNVAGEPPYRGIVQHHGWKATRCDLPGWNGSESAAQVVAPVEVEVK